MLVSEIVGEFWTCRDKVTEWSKLAKLSMSDLHMHTHFLAS